MDNRHVYMLDITIAFVIFAFGYCAIEIVKNYADDATFTRQVLIILLMLSPWILLLATRRVKHAHADDFSVNYQDLKGNRKRTNGWSLIALTTLSCMVVNALIMYLANFIQNNGLVTFQVQPADIYLFYAAIAIAEETTFRVLIVTAIAGALSLVIKNSRIPVFIAAIVSSVLFSFAHLNVYGSKPILLWGIGIAGFFYALYYGLTKNPLITFVVHVGNNLIAASFLFAAAII